MSWVPLFVWFLHVSILIIFHVVFILLLDLLNKPQSSIQKQKQAIRTKLALTPEILLCTLSCESRRWPSSLPQHFSSWGFEREKSSPPLTPFSWLQILKTSKRSLEGVAIVEYQKVHNKSNSDEKNNIINSVGSGTCASSNWRCYL